MRLASKASSPPRRRQSFTEFLGRREVMPFLLLVPVLIFFIIWNTIPTLWLLGLSFYRFSLTSGRPPIFAGFYNFDSILNDSAVWLGLSRTFLFVILAVGIETVLGLLLGLLFWGSQKLPGRRVALTLLFTPMVLTPVASGTFWRLIYDPTFGILGSIFRGLGLPSLNFLGDAHLAFGAVLLVDIWMWTPFMVLMTLAALASVPKAELEAAEIDQLSWWQRLRLVILYHGKFILMLGILLRTIDAFKTMDLIYDMTFGGPGSTTEVIAITLYRRAFEDFTMGWSSALAVILLLISIAFTATFIFVLHSRDRKQASLAEEGA
ncbi:carbohydrate ABC transporter permease [Acidisoma silvae]|uniref:Sugar ABC transporter permease n=1 Tax=Acidisoma silvae TaxID=2802396 RepID=A0A963YPI8_9PROT|nr:sugar ABC transporter permease [Acidisoma silvae]MCB8874362.1 sugar ABC transporter permease [Acidisoma silvae]